MHRCTRQNPVQVQQIFSVRPIALKNFPGALAHSFRKNPATFPRVLISHNGSMPSLEYTSTARHNKILFYAKSKQYCTIKEENVHENLPLEMSIYYSTLGLATTVEYSRENISGTRFTQNKGSSSSPNQTSPGPRPTRVMSHGSYRVPDPTLPRQSTQGA